MTWIYRKAIETRLKNKGIDPDTVDIAAYWDKTLSYNENLSNIEQEVGSSLPTKAEAVPTKLEIVGSEAQTQERYDTAFGEAIEKGEAKEPIEEVGWIAKPMEAKKGRGVRELKVFLKHKIEKGEREEKIKSEKKYYLKGEKGKTRVLTAKQYEQMKRQRAISGTVKYAGAIGGQLARKRYALKPKPIKQDGPLSGLRSALDFSGGGAGFSTGGESLLATMRGGGASQSFQSKEKRTKQSASPMVNMFMKGSSAKKRKWF